MSRVRGEAFRVGNCRGLRRDYTFFPSPPGSVEDRQQLYRKNRDKNRGYARTAEQAIINPLGGIRFCRATASRAALQREAVSDRRQLGPNIDQRSDSVYDRCWWTSSALYAL